ncbi:MAG: nuclear transport factor 2 family protein [Rhodobacteraceae bacterium]|jgi:ketosteroid isomerase-like protein|nr:nuclear transport factor 2 family protein [Paracoccaceae bacterium]
MTTRRKALGRALAATLAATAGLAAARPAAAQSAGIARVQAIYAAFGAGDIAAILAHLAEDVEWEHDWGIEPLPIFLPRRGRAEVPGFFEMLRGIEFLRFEVANLLEGGNQVAAVIRLEARVIATGRTVRDLEIHLWTFGTDGLVTAFRHVADTRQFERAMG